MTRQFTLVKADAFNALNSRLVADFATLQGSTDLHAIGDRILTLAEGFSYEVVDANEDLSTAAGTKLRALPDSSNSYPAEAFGVGAAALNRAVANQSVQLCDKQIVDQPVVATDLLGKILGNGWHKYTGIQGKAPIGTIIEAQDASIADLFTVQSSTPETVMDTSVQGLRMADICLVHKGSGAALKVDNIVRPILENILVECVDQGAVGIHLDHGSFFATLDKVTVADFMDTGVVIEGVGSQHCLRECHVSSGGSAATAKVAVEIRGVPDFHIWGGQYQVARADGTGIGILVNNTDPTVSIQGGTIDGVLTEDDTAVKITGEINPMRDVIIRAPRVLLNRSDKAVIFDRASKCRLIDPVVKGATAGGALAEFTALSQFCSIEGGYDAMIAPVIVDPEAVGVMKRCTQHVLYSERAAITTDPNMTVICEHVQHVGRCKHNGTEWDRHFFYIQDDEAVTIALPFAGGTVEIIPRSNGKMSSAMLGFHSASSQKQWGGTAFEKRDGGLNGTTGSDGFVVAGISDNVLHIENRLGEADSFTILFNGRDAY